MPPLYFAAVIVAALKNVPALGYRVATENGRRIFAHHPGILIVTETWAASTKRGLRRQAPASFRWFTARGQSVMVGWDNNEYAFVWKKRIRGGASPAIRRVTDRRDLFVVCLQHRPTGRRLVVVGVHTAPIPTAKAPAMVPVAKLSHKHAGDTITQVVESTGYPVIAGGDWNTPQLLNPKQRVGPGITHAELFDGEHAGFGKAHVSTFPLHSDHPGVLLDIPVVK